MTTTPQAQRLTVGSPDGAQIAAFDHAPAGAPSGPTLVLAHGWCLTHEAWDPVAAELRRRRPDLRIISYDQPGHGHSTVGLDRSVDLTDLGATLRAVIEATTPEGEVVLAGHSMGGMTIMALAGLDLVRERVRGACLVGTAAHLPGRRAIPGEGVVMGLLARLPASVRGLPSTPRSTCGRGWPPSPRCARRSSPGPATGSPRSRRGAGSRRRSPARASAPCPESAT